MLLIVAIIFYDNFFNGTGPAGPNIDLWGWLFWALIAIPIVFFFSINFVEYKTKKTKHPYWKIILFSVSFWFIVTLIFEIFWTILGRNVSGEQEAIGLAVLWVFTPIVTGLVFLISSLVPSLVYFNIKDNQKVLKSIFYGTVILAFLIIILALLAKYTFIGQI